MTCDHNCLSIFLDYLHLTIIYWTFNELFICKSKCWTRSVLIHNKPKFKVQPTSFEDLIYSVKASFSHEMKKGAIDGFQGSIRLPITQTSGFSLLKEAIKVLHGLNWVFLLSFPHHVTKWTRLRRAWSFESKKSNKILNIPLSEIMIYSNQNLRYWFIWRQFMIYACNVNGNF